MRTVIPLKDGGTVSPIDMVSCCADCCMPHELNLVIWTYENMPREEADKALHVCSGCSVKEHRVELKVA
jgi:hypothetical protein